MEPDSVSHIYNEKTITHNNIIILLLLLDNGRVRQEEVGGVSIEPEYEEISQPKIVNENFEMEENVAYGPVLPRGRHR